MNGYTRYELFINIQKKKKHKSTTLKGLMETRWSYWYYSLQKVI